MEIENDVKELEDVTLESAETEKTEEVEATADDKKVIENEESITPNTLRDLRNMLKQVGDVVQIFESTWMSTKQRFNLSNDNMKELFAYNNNHRYPKPDPMPENETYDEFNGLDNITDEEIEKIFGTEHEIYGVEHGVTVQRIKEACNDLNQWTSTLAEYKDIYKQFMVLGELNEEKEIKKLKVICEKEEDPVKKEALNKSINKYYYFKNLEFMAEALDEDKKKRLLSAYSDKDKITYWMKRSEDKLHQMNISAKFILEISQFEKRFMDYKYHKCSNFILLYFMNLVTFCDVKRKNDPDRPKVQAMVFALNGIVMKNISEERVNILIGNIEKFLDQVIDDIPDEDKE